MSAKQAKRPNDLARIHILQKQLGLSPEDASALKLAITGKASSADMSYEQRAKLAAHMERLLPPGHAQKTAKKRLSGYQALMFSLWQQAADRQVIRDRRFTALEAFSQNLTGVAKLDWLKKPQQDMVIKALREIVKRQPSAPTGATA
jgi:phage gp16-like protein